MDCVIFADIYKVICIIKYRVIYRKNNWNSFVVVVSIKNTQSVNILNDNVGK